MNIEIQPIDQVDRMLFHNRQVFDQWRTSTASLQTLVMPEDAAQVFVPRRLLELSENPENVRLVLLEASHAEHLGQNLSFLVCEKMCASEGERSNGIDDYMHRHPDFLDLLNEERVSMDDKVHLIYNAYVAEEYPYIAITTDYEDRVEMHGKGIGSSFYDGLECALSDLGFLYLAGDVVSSNKSFFEKRRLRINQLCPEEQRTFPHSGPGSLSSNWLVKRLG